MIVLGLLGSLIPTLPRTTAFWGCHRSWIGLSPNQVHISDVLPGSPAEQIGLQSGDYVLAIDDQPFDDVHAWDHMVQNLKPGQEVRFRVQRAGKELMIAGRGAEPEVEAILFHDWQLVFAGSCIVALILLVATQSLRPMASIWRPILLILAGLGGAAAILLVDWRWATTRFYQRWPLDNFLYPWIQVSVCVTVALLVVTLATWEIREIIKVSQRDAR